MKTQINPSFILAALLAAFLFSPDCSIHAQPAFPNPDIKTNQAHEGDLVLSGNQTMIIENTHYKIDGDIYLHDSARLIIRQFIIELQGDLGKKRAIRLLDSTLLMADTTIFGGIELTQDIDPAETEAIKPGDILTDHQSRLVFNNCFSLVQTFMGDSRVTIRNSFLMQEPLGLAHVEGRADVLIEDSYVGALFIGVPDSIPVVIDSLVPGYFEYWSVKESISENITYNLILRRTEVMENTKGYKGGMEIGWNLAINSLNSMVTVSDSRLNKLIISFPDGEPAFISDLMIGQPMNFDLNNIHLVNTEVQTQWGIFMNGGPAEIINSEGLFIFMTGGDADIIVFNSEVGEIDPRYYSGNLIYEQCTWLGGYEIFDSSHIKISGTVRMLPTVPIFDESSTMTRTYDVILLNDRNGTPFGNIPLLLKKNDTIVWMGTTDAEGKVSFDIVFDFNNAQDEWFLTADTDQFSQKKTISIYISNPVVINIEQDQDDHGYHSNIHVDASNAGFPNGTRESPYPTIQEGIDNAGGDLVYVHPGTYPGYIAPGKIRGGISLKDSITLIGAGADSTRLAGSMNAEGASGAGISGFMIEDGIHAISSSLSIQNTVVTGAEGNAIWGVTSDFELINNVLAGNGQDGIFLHDSSTALIKNNIIVNNTGFGINGVESASAIIDYNNVWNNMEGYHEFLPAGQHDIAEDPLFVDADSGDFHLQAGSPCIDTGDPDPKYNDPDGSRNDMGAFGGPLSPDFTTGIDEQYIHSNTRVVLLQNYPNPFHQHTQIVFEMPQNGWVNLSVYNIVGQRIRTLVNDEKQAGHQTISWDGRDDQGNAVRNGIYFYQILTSESKITRKAILLR